MTNVNILDLDKLVPEQRLVRLAGEEIDVTKIPSRVTLEVAKNKGILDSGSDESFTIMLDMIIKICKPSKQDITEDWIVDNTSLDQLLALIEFVLAPMKERAEQAETKNA